MALAQSPMRPYVHRWQVLLFACVALFQWPISISEGAGSDMVLAMLSGAHLITQALGKFTPPRSLRACHFSR